MTENEGNKEKLLENKKFMKINKSCNNLFNKDKYPTLNRKDLMSLSTINNNDFPIKKFKQMNTNRDWSLNLYNLDIEGTSPRKFSLFYNKIDFINKNNDIEKSYPIIPKQYKKPNYNLSNEDIEGSKPHCSKCKITRNTNPLEPKYSLPKCEEFPIENEKKFLRNTLNIDDIIGAKPKKYISNKFLRDSLNKDDIKDSSPKKPYIRKDKYNNMDYKDVYQTKNKSTRNINPLMPIYNWKYPVNNLRYNVGFIEGSTSNSLSKYKYINPFNLRNDDIEDSNTGSKNKYKKYKGSNSCLNIRDIYGATHGSLLKGISTKRNLNPLYPKYKYLGEIEIKNEKNLVDLKNNSINKKIDNNYSYNNFITSRNDNINENKILNNLNNSRIIIKNGSFELKSSNKELNGDKKIESNNQNHNNKKIELKNNNEDKIKIYNYISNLNEFPQENEDKFDKNIYKKPDIYYPYRHDKTIIPQDKQNSKEYINYNPRLLSFQQVVNEKIKLINQPKSNSISKNPIKSYEDKMDDFFVKSTINMYKSQQKLKNNINAYYDIGFPEELKAPDIVPKF